MEFKYLYGASIQGIQEFLFETGKLKEISGASEVVDYICTDFFKKSLNDSFDDTKLLIGAAGNIKYLFEREEDCKKLVYDFPRKVMETAPGITVSQAVVKFQGDFNQNHIQELEKRLKIQRNKSQVQHGLGLMVSERAPKTGKPGIPSQDSDLLDEAQVIKRNAARKANQRLLNIFIPNNSEVKSASFPSSEMDEIAGKGEKWIAVIHADGNDLGKKIAQMAGGGNPGLSTFRELSEKIGKATEKAARIAFEEAVAKKSQNGFFPFRPIVVGGDDLTVIIRGSYAIEFTKIFLKEFEEATKAEFQNFAAKNFSSGLTACAGIAFIKPSYPFHYGVHLADELCKKAKKVAKSFNQLNATPSCLLFHRVHSSYIEKDFDEIIKQEMTAQSSGIRLDFGPYFLQPPNDDYASIEQLQKWASILSEPKSPKSRLRNWLTELQDSEAAAEREFERLKQFTNKNFVEELKLEAIFKERQANSGSTKHTHLYDAILISAIQNEQK